MSQSILAGSETFWFPYVSEPTCESLTLAALNERHAYVNRCVANLTGPQTTAFNKSKNPNLFYPASGLFLSDFMVGLTANRVLRKKTRQSDS